MSAVLLLAVTLAPACPPAEPPPGAPGCTRLSWGGTPWEVTLSAGGGWSARCGDLQWEGTYSWSPSTRTLAVREWVVGEGAPYSWSVTLDGRLAGEVSGPDFKGTAVKLAK